MIDVRPVGPGAVGDAEAFFQSDPTTRHCFCMWFIIRVADYHAGGHERNKELFRELVETSEVPVGLLAYRDGETVGWCATGPRARYARAVRTPSFRGREPSEDEGAWMVPCFFIAPDARRGGVARALLEGAVALAREHGATAIEGFPFAQGAKVSRDSMVGVESLFASCGFSVIRRPSKARVVMRLDLAGRSE